MNKQEVLKVMAVLKATYPSYYNNLTKDDAEIIVGLWMEFLEKYEYIVVNQAVKNLIRTRADTYPPVIGEVVKQVELLTTPHDTNIELWNQLMKAATNCLWDPQDKFNSLPKPCQLWLGDANRLKDLAMLPIETLSTVTKGQFLKGISEISEREAVREQLPDTLKILLSKPTKELPFTEE